MATRYLTTSEAAELLHVGRNTLSRWVRDGIVEPAYTTPGGQHRWDIDDLRKQLKVRDTEPPHAG